MNLKEILKPVRYIIILVTIILNLSCNFFTEPEPFVNKNAHPPEAHYKNAKLTNYSEDQIVTGTITVNFTMDWDPIYTDSVIVFIDSARIAKIVPSFLYSPQYQFQFKINTKAWPNGKYNIILYAYKIPSLKDSLGTMSLLNNALYIYKTSLIFDNTLPTVPKNVVVTLQNGDAKISWSPTNLSNFKSYIIQKDGNIIAKIDSQNTASYIDTTLPDFYHGYYEVGASNGPQTAYSDKYSFTKGKLLGLDIISVIDGLDDQVVFVQSNDYLTAVSTQTGTIINQSNDGHGGHWKKNIYNDTLYCYNGQYLYTYDIQNLNLIKTQNVYLSSLENSSTSSQIFDFAIGLNQLYFSVSNDDYNNLQYSYYLYIFNKNLTNFDIINSSPVLSFSDYNTLSISPDGKNLLTIDGTGFKNYSLINNTVTLIGQSTQIDNLISSYVDWKNSKIFILRSLTPDNYIIEARDIRTSNLIQTYQLPGPQQSPIYINAFYVNSNNLYVAYDPIRHLLAEYNINSGQLTRTWNFSSEIYNLYGSYTGKYLFACNTTDQWIVDIGANQ